MRCDRRAVLAGGLALVASRPLTAAAQPAPTAQAGDASRASRLIAAAMGQIGITTAYDPAYVKLKFPAGDVPRDRGVCTDVIVRAYRDGLGLDLQALVNADMRAHFPHYPRSWGLNKPDPNIDHRRVPNLRVFFARKGAELERPASLGGWMPADIVTLELAPPESRQSGLAHIGIVGDALNGDRTRRLVIHNIGAGAHSDDILAPYRITGRYRWLPGA